MHHSTMTDLMKDLLKKMKLLNRLEPVVACWQLGMSESEPLRMHRFDEVRMFD